MIKVEWNNEKNALLKQTRNICFEDVEKIILDGGLLDIKPDFNIEKFPNQKILILRLNNYIHYVPFVMNNDTLFLKSIIPSRKLNKIYTQKDKT
ncbi:MAG TPA: toxin [Sulfurovum sp.]|nr:toxin [Sulfurovum sp.]